MIRQLVGMLWFVPICLWAQSIQPQLDVQVSSGTEAGWWVFDKGLTDSLPALHRGYDRSHLAFMVPVEAGVILSHHSWELGLHIAYRTMYDDVLIGSDHRRRNFNKYALTEGDRQVRMLQWGLHLGYSLIQKARYQCQAGFKFGSFNLIQVRSAGRPFGFRWFQEIMLNQKIRLNKQLQLLIIPQYARMHIQTVDSPYEEESHDIYRIGFHMGLRLRLR